MPSSRASSSSSSKKGSVSVSSSSLKPIIKAAARKLAAAEADEASHTSSEDSEPDPPVILSKIRPQPKKAKPMPTQPTPQQAQASSSSSSKQDMPSEPKKQKLAPLFAPRKSLKEQQNEPAYDANGSPRLVWRTPLKPRVGAEASCLFGEYGEPWARAIAAAQEKGETKDAIKVAAFDLDGTIIHSTNGTNFADANDERKYKPVFNDVYAQIKAEYKAGSVIAIISNQKITGTFKIDSLPSRQKTWQRKLALITKEIGVPLVILAALADDSFRKPMTSMWDFGILGSLERAGGKKDWISVGASREKGGSFYVGDAAGREARKGAEKDHNDTDRKWAINVGIPFFTPEEYFRGAAPEPYVLQGHRPVFSDAPLALPANLLPPVSDRSTDMVLFVGPPGAGKTSLYRRVFEKAGYVWVNQDTLGTRPKCVAAASTALQGGSGVVIDNTNRDVATRAHYFDLAQRLEMGTQVRCVYFQRELDQCVHNNYYRAFSSRAAEEAWRAPVPTMAIQKYFNELEVPTLAEGFAHEPIHMAWAFEGDEVARKEYAKWWVDAPKVFKKK